MKSSARVRCYIGTSFKSDAEFITDTFEKKIEKPSFHQKSFLTGQCSIKNSGINRSGRNESL